MESLPKRFEQLVKNAQKILLISHVSPDPDATSSILLLGASLELNYPDKDVRMSAEELPDDLDFLDGYKKINVELLEQVVEEFNPNLIIMLDAMNFSRTTRGDWANVQKNVQDKKIPLVIIDHHEPVGVEENELYINSGNPATVQEVYELLFDQLSLKKPDGYGEMTMTGIYTDTGGFVYTNKRHRETFTIISDLLDAGINIESVRNRLNQYTESHIKALAELAGNISHSDNYSYTFFKDQFIKDWLESGKDAASLHRASEMFINSYVRNIDGRQWGFIVYRYPKLGEDMYAVSLRAISGTVDVAAIAAKINGGGHKPAAGGKVQAKNIEDAIAQVHQAIKG